MERNTLDYFQTNRLILDTIQAAVEQYPPNEFSGTAEMWEKLFSRRKANRAFDSFFRMLDHKNDLTLGIANLSEERFFSDYVKLYTEILDEEDIRRIAPGLTGCPSLLQVHSLPANIAVMQNETRVKQLLKQMGTPSKPLRVLEIGAGYGGMANLLIKRGIVSSLTIVDLPDNLAQSAYFLTCENPEFQAHYCEASDQQSENHLNFFTPNEIDKLDNSSYDLIINCDSLGEMPAEVARNYVAFVSEKLSSIGTFYSKNGVQRNENTVVNLSDYGFDRFHLNAIMATPLSTGLFDDHSTVLFLNRGPAANDIDWKSLDLLSRLYKFGLSTELEELASRLSEPELQANQRDFLEKVALFFSSAGATVPDRQTDFGAADLNAAFTYVLGMYEFVFRSQDIACSLLSEYIEQAASPLAEGQARIFLSKYRKASLNDGEIRSELTRFFINTIRLPIKTDEAAHTKFLNAAERRVQNRFLGQLPGWRPTDK
jgi:hypothetical protein